MKVDRYTKFVLTIIALALSTLAFKDIVAPQPAVAAAPTEEGLQCPTVCPMTRSAVESAVSSSISDCLDGAGVYLQVIGSQRMGALDTTSRC